MKYLIQSILVAVTLLTVSCNDYLDRFPKDSFSEPTFFKTENDLIYYANQFYGSLPVQRMDNDNNSDNMVPQNINTFLAGTYTVPGSGGGWASGDWANIRSCNYFFRTLFKSGDLVQRTVCRRSSLLPGFVLLV
ncbi:hypothetical protein [Bacteroides faecis]|uniref:hypothetical protein n=1 Tax=Bacteroides faecis TaxID=674529 RepID=UPI00286D8C2F|nr:hypothetical protein [Bacteroides faecis]MCS2479078.1 hypothetical protein [Bacteroides faecis]